MLEGREVARLLAYEEIRQLVARYAFAVDTRDLDGLVALFVEDVAVGRQATGRAALRDYFSLGFEPLGFSILNVGTHVIDLIDETEATGEVYCSAEIERDDMLLRQAILYRDRYRLTADGWRFVQREHLLWYSAPLGIDPRGLGPVDWPRGHVGRGTVPECFDSYQAFAEEIERRG